MNRRIILTIIMLLIVIGVIAVWWLQFSAQEAPLRVGEGGSVTSDSTQDVDELGYAPPPRDLLVTTNRAGSWDLLLLKPDGSSQNLTDDGSGAVDILGTWSLDGSVINYLSDRGDGEDLTPTQVRADGSDLRTLTVFSAALTMFREGLFDWDPMLSPDGETLLWASVRDLNLELYSISTDVEFTIRNAERLTNSPAREWFHTWSPDGTKIAYSSDVEGNENIYIRDVASGEVTQITDHPNDDSRPIWLRDGSGLLFVSERDVPFSSGDLRLYIMDVDGGNQRDYAGEAMQAGAQWSPDGQYIAYMVREDNAPHWQVHVSSADGSTSWRVVDTDADYLIPVWRP